MCTYFRNKATKLNGMLESSLRLGMCGVMMDSRTHYCSYKEPDNLIEMAMDVDVITFYFNISNVIQITHYCYSCCDKTMYPAFGH